MTVTVKIEPVHEKGGNVRLHSLEIWAFAISSSIWAFFTLIAPIVFGTFHGGNEITFHVTGKPHSLSLFQFSVEENWTKFDKVMVVESSDGLSVHVDWETQFP